MMNDKRNLSMLTDYYELSMANGYFESGMKDLHGCFDLFFRTVPDSGGYAIMAGVEQLVEYLSDLSFDGHDIDYLRKKGSFSNGFLEYMRDFRFACDVWAVPEGTPIFPLEPLVVVKGPIIQAQLIETMALVCINHQSLIATKASRMVAAAKGRPVLEFGARRAQGADASVLGARAAYIAGCAGTSNVLSDRDHAVPAAGTMAHSWVQMFDSELDAFFAYARAYPNDCTLLIDTYNVLRSGVPHAIRTAKEVLEPNGYRLKGVRIDSGDIAYLSKKTRQALDEAGLTDCKITVSNSLDEWLIRELLNQGAMIDTFGIGERLITSRSEPVFGGVYKLSGVFRPDGSIEPKMKISENVEKITNPCFKKVYRLTDKSSGMYIADLLTLHDEVIDESQPYVLFDPNHIWKRKTVKNFKAEELLVPLFERGKCVYQSPPIAELKAQCSEKLSKLWGEVKRFRNPQPYYVDLSLPLWEIKNDLIMKISETEKA